MSKYQSILDELNASIKAPTTNAYAKEPEWLMRIAEGETYLTSGENASDMSGASKDPQSLTNFCPIYDYQFGLSRGFNPDSMANDLVPRGMVGHELKVVAPFAAIGAKIHQAFATNTILTSVTIARLGVSTASGTASAETSSAPGSHHSLAEFMFTDAFITAIVSKHDLISLAFRYNAVTYSKKELDPTTGASTGTTGSAYHNLVNGASKAPTTATSSTTKAK